jgi:hypothetical protein
MARLSSRDDGFSPPSGSVFSTRKRAPDPEPASFEPLSDEQLALAAFDRGLELVARKDLDRALEAWVEAAMLDPTNRTYQANLKRLERLLASSSI